MFGPVNKCTSRPSYPPDPATASTVSFLSKQHSSGISQIWLPLPQLPLPRFPVTLNPPKKQGHSSNLVFHSFAHSYSTISFSLPSQLTHFLIQSNCTCIKPYIRGEDLALSFNVFFILKRETSEQTLSWAPEPGKCFLAPSSAWSSSVINLLFNIFFVIIPFFI